MTARPLLLSEHLRAETAQDHARLEARLDLLRPHPDRARFVRLLEGFYGFHLGWEGAVAGRPAAEFSGEGRLAFLRQDLTGLGVTVGDLAQIRPWEGVARLAGAPAVAHGCAYVIEGSALGGQLIARALADAPWRPPGGLRYFDPYGTDTGARWRAFKATLDTTPAHLWPQVVQGARGAFALLADRLEPDAAAATGERD